VAGVILRIDHVGLVTADPAGVGRYLDALGLRATGGGPAADYGVTCEFWQLGNGGPAVEVVAPVSEGSAVTDYLRRKGAGLYHIAFEVDDLEFELARLRRSGFAAVDARPCAGARPGMQVAFMYAGKPAGLLIELVRYAPVTQSDPRAGGPAP
jgi:methylmalonyl-CoA/ethylmalonyl-CoA epimerase